MFNCDSRTILLITVTIFLLALFYFTTTPGSDEHIPISTTSPSTTKNYRDDDYLREKKEKNSDGEQQQQQQQEPRSPHSSLSANKLAATNRKSLPKLSGGIFWSEKGNTGWRRPTRQKDEIFWTCPKIRENLQEQYSVVKKNVNFNSGPRFSMPWFFHDPYPVCGSVLLRHLHGSLDTVPVLRVADGDGEKFLAAAAEDDHDEQNKNIENKNKILLSPIFDTNERNFKETFGDLNLGGGEEENSETKQKNSNNNNNKKKKTEIVDVVAGIPFDKLLVEDCGDQLGFSSVLITSRLVSYNFITNAQVVSTKTTTKTSSPSSKRKISFTAPFPGSYVLEVKIVHANGTSDNPRTPRSLGVVGIRAVVGNRKAFKYNAKCDYQRHIFGSPLLIRAHGRDSKRGRELLPFLLVKSSSSSSSKDSAGENDSENQKEISSSTSVLNSENNNRIIPLCQRGDYDFGFWVRMENPKLCHMNSNLFCKGDPEWVSDACAYNNQYVWVPTTITSTSSFNDKNNKNSPPSSSFSSTTTKIACRYQYFSPPQGPARSCLRFGESRAFLYLVGDSVIREYAKNCDLISLRSAKLQCLFANIALEGQHFSNSYAESVAKTIVQNIRENNAGIFASNLGLQHMIGPCTTKQWRIFVRYFVLFWKQQIVWAKKADPTSSSSSTNTNNNNNNNNNISIPFIKNVETENEKVSKFYREPKYLRASSSEWPKLEQAIWIGPPTIQYARKGMGSERAALWDEIAWKELEPLGFQRMKTIPPTASRQEATWDGLHYASEKNKVQTIRKNMEAKVYRWNGGVSNLLFTILLNMICNR